GLGDNPRPFAGTRHRMNPNLATLWIRPGLRFAPAAAAVLFAVSVIGFGAALGGYSHLAHPVALLGADRIAHAPAFDALGFVLPGLLAAWTALALRATLPTPAPWPLRI